jgi:LPS-assembly protein
VGRINTSLKERRVVDAIVGFEYDGCCWIGRAVLERLQTGTGSANVRLLFQIEFVGFARLGTNAMTPLKANIPRYQLLRDQAAAPSRFTQYD